jgi:hypothetical protein
MLSLDLFVRMVCSETPVARTVNASTAIRPAATHAPDYCTLTETPADGTPDSLIRKRL